jgi:uncharacterized membrane protein YraQ (UPF0718 family)
MTKWKTEWQVLVGIGGVFVACFYMPLSSARFRDGVMESLQLVQWYAREHVVLCLVPAFFIAGAIAVFVSHASVIKYLGPKANKILSYGVASVSGAILAVCSCTVLPLFAGIYRMGAGLGPATAFLYSGPAINILAIILTARVLGVQIGIARAVGAIIFSVVIGLCMHFIFRGGASGERRGGVDVPDDHPVRPLWQNAGYFAAMVGILVFANWSRAEQTAGFWNAVYSAKWIITSAIAIAFAIILGLWFGIRWWKITVAAAAVALSGVVFPQRPVLTFGIALFALSVITISSPGPPSQWFASSWGFARQILPLLFIGVLVAGFLLARPGREGVIPSQWISQSVGGNSLRANLIASVAGALMYFATLTEIPILQGLLGAGMGKGPGLALLLAGPAVSLPNMLVIRSVIGTRKTIVYVLLVIVMATVSGLIFGAVLR